jgi:hypothetical protein
MDVRTMFRLKRSRPVEMATLPFYRRYPVSSPIPISKIDQYGIVDPDLRFFFNRIPKAANTSTTMTLYKFRFGAAPLTRKTKLYAKYKAFRRPSNLSDEDVAALDRAFKFAFVRNPFARVLSAYMDKAPKKAPTHAQASFAAFCHYLADGGINENPHWSPQVALFLLPSEAFDFLGRVERFDDDLAHAMKQIGAAIEPVRYSENPTGADLRLASAYDAESRQIVTKLYSADFETFGYSSAIL